MESGPAQPKKIWIDLDNSPHVPFFAPIIEKLEKRGYSVLVTARDCFQVCDLANLLQLRYRLIGHHYGKSRVLKLVGLFLRAIQLTPTVLSEKPDVALSHGSRSQVLIARLLHVPSMVICDYEFAKGLSVLHPGWVMTPDVIDDNTITGTSRRMKYPGIKEDVYVPQFRPDPSILATLGVDQNNLVVTVRPPANEAHYHNPESEALLDAVFEFLGNQPQTTMVLLPRNHRQEMSLRRSRPSLFASGKVTVPCGAVDGLNLIWHSDLVISGGGTMNREAAALGVPVYSIFRGKIGAVDRHLAATGRLILVESVDDVRTKIVLHRRFRSSEPKICNQDALRAIVDNVVSVVESTCRTH